MKIYLDNSATTQISKEVLNEMLPYLKEYYGNPSSLYELAGISTEGLKIARQRVAQLLNCLSEEIFFTSCATESNNTAIHSAIESTAKKHIITTKVEHKAVLEYCKYLEKKGYKITYLEIDQNGNLDLKQLEKSITKDTALISVMYVNNETGVIFPVEKIANIAKSHNVLFHTDAVQAVGKVDINLKNIPIDFLSLSGHKIHAPKGVGVLFVRKGVKFIPLLYGGGQEQKRRPGTENVASIVGLGKACELLYKNSKQWRPQIKELRDYLESSIIKMISNVSINGSTVNRVCSISNMSFQYIESEAICLKLDKLGIMVSAGSACTSTSLQPSHVLVSMHVPFNKIHGSIRFSLSHYTTRKEIEYVLLHLKNVILQLRKISPLYNTES